jgi:hypothetical protein
VFNMPPGWALTVRGWETLPLPAPDGTGALVVALSRVRRLGCGRGPVRIYQWINFFSWSFDWPVVPGLAEQFSDARDDLAAV